MKHNLQLFLLAVVWVFLPGVLIAQSTTTKKADSALRKHIDSIRTGASNDVIARFQLNPSPKIYHYIDDPKSIRMDLYQPRRDYRTDSKGKNLRFRDSLILKKDTTCGCPPYRTGTDSMKNGSSQNNGKDTTKKIALPKDNKKADPSASSSQAKASSTGSFPCKIYWDALKEKFYVLAVDTPYIINKTHLLISQGMLLEMEVSISPKKHLDSSLIIEIKQLE